MKTHDKLKDIIQKTEKPITKDHIKQALKELGLHSKSKIEVHASLSAFGFIVNKEYDIIDALLETIGQGVVIMPGHTSEMSDPKDWENPSVPKEWFDIIINNRKPFNPQVFQAERIGQVAKTFANYPGVKRTLHPEVSLSIYNKTGDKSWLNHGFDDRDLIHPLYKLKEEKGQILMMGTDFYTCSSIHLSEFMSQYSTIEKNDYQIVIDGQITKKTIVTKYFDDDELNFKEISEKYIKSYQGTEFLKKLKLGLGTLTLIDAFKLYEIAKEFHLTYKK